MKGIRALLVINIVVMCLTGCGSFRAHNLPDSGPAAQVGQFSDKTKIYVQESLKPQDNGEFCVEWHGCIWHGKNTFGERLTNQYTQLGASSYFLGLSRQERFDSHQREDDIYGHRVDAKADAPADPARENPYKTKLESNKTIKANMGPGEYWVDSKIRFTSNSAGEWLAKSLLTGFTLTMIPVWQEISTEVDLTVTNYKQQEVWNKTYKDSYTGFIWFFLFPMASTMSSVPDAVTENIAETAANDMMLAGVFTK